MKFQFVLSCAPAALATALLVSAPAGAQVAGQTAQQAAGQTTGSATAASAATPGGTVDASTNAAPSADGSTDATIGDIIVTAQKREENVQRTPIAITALTQELNSRAGVRDFADIQKVAPDVSIFAVSGATSIAIRGVRQTALGPTNDTTTATHLDGVYLSRPTGLTGFFYDIQRIEILKGPQGTLYGRNATGGAVNIITNKPNDTFGARGEFEAGNYQLHRAEAAINLPISDFLAVRVAGHDYGHQGYLSNGQGGENEKGARGEALFKISTRAKLLLTADYELSNATATPVSLFSARITSFGQPAAKVPIPADPFTASPIIYPYGTTQYNQNRSELYGFNGQLDVDLGFATLTGQLGHRHVQADGYNANVGATLVPQPLVLTPGPPPPGPPGPPPMAYGYTRTPAKSQSTSGEIRLSSASTRPLQWLVGGYYFYENFSGELCQLPNLYVTSPCSFRVSNGFNQTKAYAFFGQATYTPPILNDALHITGGVRYSNDEKRAATQTQVGPFILTNDPNAQATFKKTTYRAALAYDITTRNLIYGSVSSGFRAGGFAYGTTPLYKPESITAYEIGSKNRFLNNRVQLNLEGWIYDYTNTEQNVVLIGPTGGLADLTVVSIGSVKYKGATAQLDVAVTKHDHLSGFVQYNDAHYGSFVIPAKFTNSPPLTLAGVPNGQPAGDYSGNQVANTPRWTGNVSADHDFDVLDGTLDFRAAMQFSTKRNFGTYAPGTLQYDAQEFPGYTRYDLSVRYAPTSGHFKVTAYVNNVGNVRTVNSGLYEITTGTGTGLVAGNLLPPRTFGAIFGFDF